MRKYVESINIRKDVQHSLAIREIQIKTTEKYYVKSLTVPNAGDEVNPQALI